MHFFYDGSWHESAPSTVGATYYKFEELPKDFEDYDDYEVIGGKMFSKNKALYENKKLRAREIILSRYSESDQMNLQQDSTHIIGSMIIEQRGPTNDEAQKLQEAKNAKEFREAVLEELHTNKGNADFSKLI